MSIEVWIGIVAAPALLGLCIYFVHDYIQKLNDRFTRIDGQITSLEKSNIDRMTSIKHQIEIVMNDERKERMIVEIDKLRHDFDKFYNQYLNRVGDFKDTNKFIQRHEKALANVYLLIKSHHNRIQELHKDISKLNS